jgi:hypothetical protein
VISDDEIGFFLKFELESLGSESIDSRYTFKSESTTTLTFALNPTLVLKREKLFIFNLHLYIILEGCH